MDLPHTIKSLLYAKGLQRIFSGDVKLINGKNMKTRCCLLGVWNVLKYGRCLQANMRDHKDLLTRYDAELVC